MSIEHEVRQANEERLAALAAGDVETLDECLSDDLSYIAAVGAVLTKDEVIANVRSGVFKVESFGTEDFKVKHYGDAAVAVCRTTMTSSFRGQQRSGSYGTTAVYARQKGRWRLVAHQMTTLLPPQAPQPQPRPS